MATKAKKAKKAKKAQPVQPARQPQKKKFDRTEEDLGNIVHLEHVNVTIPDQQISTLFYIAGLGLTRDPYMMTSTNNMWVNAGRSQFHLPTDTAQVLRGRIGLVMPNIEGLARRLEAVRDQLHGTKFDFGPANGNDAIDVTCPWGNRFRCHMANDRFAPVALGMPYVQFDVRPGAADGIARFYREIIGTAAELGEWEGAPAARVMAGLRQELVFRETKAREAAYDGHHIQVYVVDFSGPYHRLLERGLVSEESSQHQYRFVDIVDPDDGTLLFQIDHEVRALTHPLYARPLVNRNPDQHIRAYIRDHDAGSWAFSTPA